LLVQLPLRPDLQVFTVNGPTQVTAGGTASLSYVVINQGTAAASGRWHDKVFLSLDNRVSSDDQLLDTLDNEAAHAPGETYQSQQVSFSIPKRFAGSAFLLVETDADAAVNEFPNDDNNVFALPVDVIPLPPADLVTGNVVAPDLAFDGSTIEVHYQVSNLGS